MTNIFVSYRRADSDVIAGRIRDRLARAYGDQSVFMDIDNIPFGVDFRSHVQDVLDRGDVMIAVIGPNWLGRDEKGQSRLEDETDPVRLELEAALQRKMPVVPVLVHDAKMPKPADLPPSMRDFAFYNAADVDSGRDFHPHMDRLMRSISRHLVQSPSQPKRTAWLVGAGVAVVALIGAAAFVLHQTQILPLWPSASPVVAPAPQDSTTERQVQAGPIPDVADEPWRALPLIGVPAMQSVTDDWRRRGYHPRTISGFLVDNVPNYALLWSKDQRPGAVSGWEYDERAFQRRYGELSKSGLRPVFVGAYEGPSGTVFADVWERSNSPEWLLRWDLTADELRRLIDEHAKQGLQLGHLYGYAKGGQSNFVAIFERRLAGATISSVDLSAAEFQKGWDFHIKLGHKPLAITGYQIGQTELLAILWGAKGEGGAGHANWRMPGAAYSARVAERMKLDMRLLFLAGYAGPAGPRYNLIWGK